MYTVVDAIARALASTYAEVALWLLIAVVTAVWIGRALRRRRDFQAFAESQPLTFVGTIPSDARLPYIQIPRVASAVLLTNVLEGDWDGLPVCVCEVPPGRRQPTWTTILVTVEDILLRGPGADRVIAGAPAVPLVETSVDVLSVSPRRKVEASELPTWLSFATSLAKAMERDFKETLR